MAINVDPKVDYAFKWLFGREKNTRLLIHLLHAILNPTPEEQIVEIQILNPFSEQMALDGKRSILDIKARDQRGRQFNVEMQRWLYSLRRGASWTRGRCPDLWIFRRFGKRWRRWRC